VLWFRPEVIQTVNWGGDPNKPYQTGSMGDRLTPRASFDLWQETVRGKSLPWKPVELEAALRLRNAVAEVIVRRAEELARLNVELARSNVELDSFAYVASHDLKEPLRGINNYIRFFREDHGDLLPEEARAKLDTLTRLTRRMDSLLDSLLHYSRVGRQDMTLEKADLNQVLNESVEALQSRLNETGTEVRIPRPLPGPVSCDPVQVGEVFTNLISNAAKYSDRPAGERWVEVGWIDPEREENSAVPPDVKVAVYYVRDNGIGIAEKHRDVVFRIFKRLHGRGEYSGGTGAGLTIAQKIVERHGGRIWLESAVGEGTTFYFTLAAKAEGDR
jgi:light-regulated signal transduction histidine kinase (bacteriophytochrome)